MIIHTHGWKAERDRSKLTGMYGYMVDVFKVKRLTDGQLAKLDNFALHRLCQDIYDSQAPKEIRWYNERIGVSLRSREFAWRWFWFDLFHPKIKPVKKTGVPFVTA
jgi:hypothetical protein